MKDYSTNNFQRCKAGRPETKMMNFVPQMFNDLSECYQPLKCSFSKKLHTTNSLFNRNIIVKSYFCNV